MCKRLVSAVIVLSALATPTSAAQEPSFDPIALGDYLYETVPRLMDAEHVPGAAVVVVAEGKLIFADGFGVASLETEAPVDPETTLFRIRSRPTAASPTACAASGATAPRTSPSSR